MKTDSLDFNGQLYSLRENLRRFAVSLTRNDEDAEDLVQDTMFKAIKNSERFEAGTNLKSWLYMILKNTFINNYRRKNRMNYFMTENSRDIANNLEISSSSNHGESKCILNDIYYLLERLPYEYYYPFIKYFEGYKYQEIANELQIPIGTVKTRIYCARVLLKKNLRVYKEKIRHYKI